MRSEEEFIEAIDCRFPYGDARTAHSLIDEACSISSNAAFMVAHELARHRLGSGADAATCLALLDRLGDRLVHPLEEPVLDVARRMVHQEHLESAECRALMERVGAHAGEFNALAIVCFACEDRGMNEACRAYDEIVEGWRRST